MKLVDVKEICELLNVKKSTIHVWIRNGTIPSYRLNGLIRFNMDEIIEWVKGQQTNTSNVYTLSRNISENQDIDDIIKKAIYESTGKEYDPTHRGNQTNQAGNEGA
ncbi:MAG: helix-turn-helix domain-containing protein [Deltaproteobacteria bacterium]|nr:helix-turn-helix domain-containing protein [Deltaproteobacteria bacterium]